MRNVENERIFITGGAGFIGLHVIERLLARGVKVRVFDSMMHRANRDEIEVLLKRGDVELVESDVRSGGAVQRAMTGCTRVIHFATVSINRSVADPDESLAINMLGNNNVFSAAANLAVSRLVYASSASVYGDPKVLPMSEDSEKRPLTPYCIAKLAGEQLLEFYGRSEGLSWNALRFFNVYGPGQKTSAYYTSVINHFINRLKNGEPPIIDGKGEQSMDFVHVHDVADACVAALFSDVENDVFNIGTGVSTTIAQLAHILIRAVGVDVEPVFNPRDVLVTRRAADIAKARKMLDWNPKVTVEMGMESLVKAHTR
jgi:UDP-glucose 4-epimerase